MTRIDLISRPVRITSEQTMPSYRARDFAKNRTDPTGLQIRRTPPGREADSSQPQSRGRSKPVPFPADLQESPRNHSPPVHRSPTPREGQKIPETWRDRDRRPLRSRLQFQRQTLRKVSRPARSQSWHLPKRG